MYHDQSLRARVSEDIMGFEAHGSAELQPREIDNLVATLDMSVHLLDTPGSSSAKLSGFFSAEETG